MANISIFGLGYVGCVGMACLARHGHSMVGVDVQQSKVDFLNAGKPTIIERQIGELMAEQHAAGRIRAIRDAAEAVAATDISFICVGTPPTSNGHLDLTAIRNVAQQIGQGLREKERPHLVALRSTVLPGTNDEVTAIIAEHSGGTSGNDFAVVSNPEFLREGSSVADFADPPFTLVGSAFPWALDTMREVYAEIDAPFIATDPRIAELMKYVCNSFHALKITFANEIGTICGSLGIDSHELMNIFCRDERLNISRAYLRPGFAYGGSCLPKDLKALCTIAHDHYLETPVLDSIARSNEIQKEIALKRILECGNRKVGFLGLAFKAGTDDLRESPIVDVIERLLGKGFDVRIYDPHVHLSRLTGANRDYILQKIPFISEFITDDLDAVIKHGETIVLVNHDHSVNSSLTSLDRNRSILDLTQPAEPSPSVHTALRRVAW